MRTRVSTGVARWTLSAAALCASGCERDATPGGAPTDATLDAARRDAVPYDSPAPLADSGDDAVMEAGVRVDVIVDATIDPGPVELGTGRERFEALPRSGATTELVMGPQGGWHIYGRVRLRGVAPDVYLTFALTPESGGAPVNLANETVRRQERRGLMASGDAYESSSGELVILADGVRPPDVVGRRFRFGVRVERPDPVMLRVLVGSDERVVTVVDVAP